MKKFLPLIIYFISLIITFLLVNNSIPGFSLIFYGTFLGIILHYIIETTKEFSQKKILSGISSLAIALVFLGIVLKFDYAYYHPIFLILPSFAILILIIINKHIKQNYILHIVLLISIINMVLSDRLILSLWNPKLKVFTEKIYWNDFKASPDTISIKNNIIALGVKYKLKKIYGNNVSGIAISGMYPDSSWTVSKDSIELRQLKNYLKISEIFTRKLRKLYSEHNQLDSIYKISKQLGAEYTHYQNLYRKDIFKDYPPKNQEYWDKKINSDLILLEEYK